MDRVVRMITSKRFVAFMASLAVLLVLALTNQPPAIVGPLAEGVGLALTALLGLETVADGAERYARARKGRADAPSAPAPHDEPQRW